MVGLRERVIDSHFDGVRRRCREGWASAIAGWRREGPDCFWLVGAANYLFRTGEARWAVDISFKNAAVYDALSSTLARDLDRLSFVLVTHAHRDHFDPRTVAALRELPATWVIPHFMAHVALGEAGLAAERVMVVRPGDRMEIRGVRMEAFPGLHWEVPGNEGTDSLGYLVDTGRSRILLPGDVRTFGRGRIPSYEEVGDLFAHVWLGRDKGLDPYPAVELEQYAEFVLSLRPSRANLTHLYETDRKPENLWTYAHAGMIMDVLSAWAPEMDIRIPRRWEACLLGEADQSASHTGLDHARAPDRQVTRT